MAEYRVGPKRVLYGKGTKRFPAGKTVSKKLLECGDSDWDSLVRDGAVVEAGAKSEEKPKPKSKQKRAPRAREAGEDERAAEQQPEEGSDEAE